jgi:glutamate dehydrogenase
MIDKNKVFSASYISYASEQDIEQDLQALKTMNDDFTIRIYCKDESINHFRIYSKEEYNLSQIIPILENMGFNVIKQVTNQLNYEGKTLYMQDYALANNSKDCMVLNDEHTKRLSEGLKALLSQEVINDELVSLLNNSKLNTQQIKVLRSLVSYTQQIGTKYSINAIRKIYALNVNLVETLFDLFDAKFNPVFTREQSTEKFIELEQKYLQEIKNVKSLDEEIVLKDAFGLIKAMLRTNYYTNNISGLAFKFDSKQVPNMPKPAPLYEIFVYHKDLQGVHLRGGKVARGGLRWSDRPADFRSEVLGLVKTQITKNAVIVPTGSKGGFVIRKPLDGLSQEEFNQAGIDGYKIFIKSLLSVTDNIVDGDIITPTNVVRYDEQDPYLVVAADKGTATFSDIANDISIEHGFWLQDAFASGGKNGYDHKKMGITAKGAWENVKRHFRHYDMDIQKQDFTVVGIGGMAGDVFGNGMLLSKKINLVAAFNHRAIFIDPTPNVEVAYKERQKLFADVQSWEFYNKDLISKGGGVFSRKDKSIVITPEMKKVFDIKENELTPDELIVKLMKAPVDLIWNGGIGTFVKSSFEENSQVPDRANDAIRINGKDIRAKVMGEGGNLGFTQLGRIEYNNHGGKIYTDAIDNSAGVSCSDREVNIKILLELAINNGVLKAEDRNSLLESMTSQIEEKVLLDNYEQGALLDLEFANAEKNLNFYKDLMKDLEDRNLLDRDVENLPSDLLLNERLAQGKKVFSLPELSVLLAYAKIDLTAKLLETSLVQAPSTERFLTNYFPQEVQKFATEIKTHKLKDNIIATQLANYIINKMGLAFVIKMQVQSVSTVEDLVRSYLISEKLFNLPTIYKAINALDNKVNASVQVDITSKLQTIIEKQCLWYLRNLEKPLHVVDSVDLLQKVLANSNTSLEFNLDNLETTLSQLKDLQNNLDAAFMAYNLKQDFAKVNNLFNEIAQRMSLDSIVEGVQSINIVNTYDEIASKEFVTELHGLKAGLAKKVLESNLSLSDYITQKRIVLEFFRNKVASIELSEYNYSIVKVLVSRLKSLLS